MTSQAWKVYLVVPPPILTQNLELEDVPRPAPGPGQVLVRIVAVRLIARDPIVVSHDPFYPLTCIDGLIPCSDNVGIIEDLGPETEGKQFELGDRVIVHSHTSRPAAWRSMRSTKRLAQGMCTGTLPKYIVADLERLVRVPDNVGLKEASAASCAGLTACNDLLYGGVKIEEGVTVVTQRTGKVSLTAIQIAHALGATVTATSSSDEKLALAKKVGATHLIRYYTTPDWARLTNGKGVDVAVIDII